MNWWYRRSLWSFLLLPLSLVFCCVVELRRVLYRTGMLESVAFNIPVVVVGNLTVGGTGKTPLVVSLAHHLAGNGYRPIIITRGYKGKNRHWPMKVNISDDPLQLGDEAVLLAQRAGCPVYAGPDRVADIRKALQDECSHAKTVMILDDGLQHYRLARDIEIVVMDGERRLGNRLLLPAGPLREAPSRLSSVDFIVIQGQDKRVSTEYLMQLKGDVCIALCDRQNKQHVCTWQGETVHAVAGIGNPERFFTSLENRGMCVIRHPFADHHAFSRKDICFYDDLRVVMTEKDAVKCQDIAGKQHWYLPVETVLEEEFLQNFLTQLTAVNNRIRMK